MVFWLVFDCVWIMSVLIFGCMRFLIIVRVLGILSLFMLFWCV